MSGPRLLVVDDEAGIRETLGYIFIKEGFEVLTASNFAEGQTAALRSNPDVILCDIKMPDGNGLDLLKKVKEEHPQTPMIMITAHTSTEDAVEAMKRGAIDYISKPFNNDELVLIVRRALGEKTLQEENVYLKQELAAKYTFANIIGKGSRMQEIFRTIERIGKVSSTVLITGESGTGKELIARAIHYTSVRKAKKFVSINCGALPETLLESELFGHERGAFTGAVKEKRGLFSEADGGTLFLDEISETTPTMQVKLLRAIQEKVIRKVGGNEETSVDVRIIAATNKDLTDLVTQEKLRRGRRSPDAALHRQDLPGPEDPREKDLDRGHAVARGLSLARQRARARELARTDGGLGARAHHHGLEPARGDRAGRQDPRARFRKPSGRRHQPRGLPRSGGQAPHA